MSGQEEKQDKLADEPKESSIVDDSNSDSSMAISPEYEQEMFDDSSSGTDEINVYEYNMINTDSEPTYPYVLYASTSHLVSVNAEERPGSPLPEIMLEYVPSHQLDPENPPGFYVKLKKRSQTMLQRMIQRNIAYLDDHSSSSDSDDSDSNEIPDCKDGEDSQPPNRASTSKYSEEIPDVKHIANRTSTK